MLRVHFRHRFGTHIRKLRRARKLTQEALAERCELSVDAIRRIERGRLSPTLETLRKLANGLDLSLHALFQNLDADPPSPLNEICDFLTRRNGRDVRLAWRVIHAMFEEPLDGDELARKRKR
jgi:transcriptional regulator with XRE-family HTH domain